MGRRRCRIVLAWLAVTVLFAPPSAGSAGALSPAPCSQATGITITEGGSWLVSGTGGLRSFDAGWNETGDRPQPGYGVAVGPNGSTTLLQRQQVRWRNDSGQLVTVLEFPTGLRTAEVDPDSVDITYDRWRANGGRWYLLRNDTLVSYDRSWERQSTAPTLQKLVPTDARGMAIVEDTVAFVTGNGTVVVYERTAPGTFERRNRITLSLGDEAVDVHPGYDDTWLVFQPGNVTAYDGNWGRIGTRADVFYPSGCQSTGGSGASFFGLFLILVLAGGLLLVGLVVGLVVVGILWFVSRGE